MEDLAQLRPLGRSARALSRMVVFVSRRLQGDGYRNSESDSGPVTEREFLQAPNRERVATGKRRLPIPQAPVRFSKIFFASAVRA